MNVLIDIGNTRIKYLCEQNQNLGEVHTIPIQELCNEFFVKHWGNARNIIIASVGEQQLAAKISKLAASYNIRVEQVHSEYSKNGVTSAYTEFTKLGVDRWLTLLACAKYYSNHSVVIIDAGTATTIDLLDATGIHHGGWIIPGLNTMINSLLRQTSQIKLETMNAPSTNFANSTSDNVNNGSLVSTLATIEYAVKKAGEIVSAPCLIITGGNAKLLYDHLAIDAILDEKLIFKGLLQYL
jgi:type III pantothenate kinase